MRALRPGGVLFASFKHGRGERERDGRRFTDLDERGWAEVASGLAEVATASVWTTADARPSRGRERWLDVLAVRSAATDRAHRRRTVGSGVRAAAPARKAGLARARQAEVERWKAAGVRRPVARRARARTGGGTA